MKLSQSQVRHLLWLLHAERDEGSYSGPRNQYYKRRDDLIDILSCAKAGHLEVKWGPKTRRPRSS